MSKGTFIMTSLESLSSVYVESEKIKNKKKKPRDAVAETRAGDVHQYPLVGSFLDDVS